MLSKAESEYLAGKKQVNKNYEYFLQHSIRKKLQSLIESELPLLKQGSFLEDILRILENSLRLATSSARAFPINTLTHLGKVIGNRSEPNASEASEGVLWGRMSAWLDCQPRALEVAGSNPAAPIAIT